MYREWHKNGQLKQSCNYKKGVEEGKYEQWYYNGQIHIKCIYEENKISDYEEWYENGEKRV